MKPLVGHRIQSLVVRRLCRWSDEGIEHLVALAWRCAGSAVSIRNRLQIRLLHCYGLIASGQRQRPLNDSPGVSIRSQGRGGHNPEVGSIMVETS
jgi:hypothetical protein